MCSNEKVDTPEKKLLFEQSGEFTFIFFIHENSIS